MRSSSQRTDQYNAKIDPTRYETVMTAVIPLAKGNFSDYANAWVPKQAEVQAVLDAAGVSKGLYGMYYAFSMQVWHAVQTSSGEALAVQVAGFEWTWQAKGLAQAVLDAIRVTVFTVPLPTGP